MFSSLKSTALLYLDIPTYRILENTDQPTDPIFWAKMKLTEHICEHRLTQKPLLHLQTWLDNI